MNDKALFAAIAKEETRQLEHIELIASENFVSKEVLVAQGSVLTNKYAEGYPGRRYYGGCEFIDEAENLAIERAKKLFNVNYANVQPHSGSSANLAVYFALLNPGDTILGMSLSCGGHLTHGYKASISGKWFNAVHYGVHKETHLIDYDEVHAIAHKEKPKIIIAGGSAYPRTIDFQKFRSIADEVGAFLMVDMAHFAGLVAAGVFPSPVPYAHVITSTTHKTLRGPRGGIILTNDEGMAKKINSAVMPGIQGGPLMHVIAAKAVGFYENLQDDFKDYAKCVIENAKALGQRLVEHGFKLVTGGTDSHLILVDLTPFEVTGKDFCDALGSINITANMNTIPFDPLPPMKCSGMRLGTPAMTTKGFTLENFQETADTIAQVMQKFKQGQDFYELKDNVVRLCRTASGK